MNSVKIRAICAYFIPLQRYAFWIIFKSLLYSRDRISQENHLWALECLVLYPCRNWCLLVFPLLLIFLQREQWYHHVFWLARRIWAPIIIYGMGFWPRFKVFQTLEKGKNYMFVANHLSMIDIMLVLMVVETPLCL